MHETTQPIRVFITTGPLDGFRGKIPGGTITPDGKWAEWVHREGIAVKHNDGRQAVFYPPQ